MKTRPIATARLETDRVDVPGSQDHGTADRPLADPWGRARQVFLAQSDLPLRWHGRERHVVLETGFGQGNNFLATWTAWRGDPARCRQLVFVSIEHQPLAREDLRRVHAASPEPALAAQLVAAWPAATPNLHRLVFEGGRVQLLLALGDVAAWLPQLVAEVDTYFLDGFAPTANPSMWQSRLFKAMGRMAAAGATVATWTTAPVVRAGLMSAGFELRDLSDPPDDTADSESPNPLGPPGSFGLNDLPDCNELTDPPGLPGMSGTSGMSDTDSPSRGTAGRFAPRFRPKRPEARRSMASTIETHAIVLGAGLAGCAASAALAEQGWRVTLVDRHAGPAQAASGNLGGLFHGVVHAVDGHHARFNRACLLEATRAIRRLLADSTAGTTVCTVGSACGQTDRAPASEQADGAPAPWGQADGALRLSRTDVTAMRALLQRLGLPAEHVQALDAAQASALAGMPLADPAWYYPGGGWVRPAALAHAWLAAAGSSCSFSGQNAVDRIAHDGHHWRLFDAAGELLARAPVLVLANAADALRLLEGLPGNGPRRWPVEPVRGQLSMAIRGGIAGWPSPRLPVAGAGYMLPDIDGRSLFGATAQARDADPAVRRADHRHNLDRLAELTPSLATSIASASPDDLQGRTAWRCVADDRLPLIGAVPTAWVGGAASDRDQPRFVPRASGLFLFTALGSRGIAWSPLGSQILAASITGAPQPLEAELVDAVDPARFVARAARRRTAVGHGG